MCSLDRAVWTVEYQWVSPELVFERDVCADCMAGFRLLEEEEQLVIYEVEVAW
jgi:hypothetical protein